MKKTIFVFSALIISLLSLFQLSKYALVTHNISTEFIIVTIAIVSFIIGVFYYKKTSQKENEIISKEINHQKIKDLEITSREYEVLLLIEKGLSNKEIADQLFVSENTIKTHVSNLLSKLNAKRRTQAIQIAKELYII